MANKVGTCINDGLEALAKKSKNPVAYKKLVAALLFMITSRIIETSTYTSIVDVLFKVFSSEMDEKGQYMMNFSTSIDKKVCYEVTRYIKSELMLDYRLGYQYSYLEEIIELSFETIVEKLDKSEFEDYFENLRTEYHIFNFAVNAQYYSEEGVFYLLNPFEEKMELSKYSCIDGKADGKVTGLCCFVGTGSNILLSSKKKLLYINNTATQDIDIYSLEKRKVVECFKGEFKCLGNNEELVFLNSEGIFVRNGEKTKEIKIQSYYEEDLMEYYPFGIVYHFRARDYRIPIVYYYNGDIYFSGNKRILGNDMIRLIKETILDEYIEKLLHDNEWRYIMNLTKVFDGVSTYELSGWYNQQVHKYKEYYSDEGVVNTFVSLLIHSVFKELIDSENQDISPILINFYSYISSFYGRDIAENHELGNCFKINIEPLHSKLIKNKPIDEHELWGMALKK